MAKRRRVKCFSCGGTGLRRGSKFAETKFTPGQRKPEECERCSGKGYEFHGFEP